MIKQKKYLMIVMLCIVVVLSGCGNASKESLVVDSVVNTAKKELGSLDDPGMINSKELESFLLEQINTNMYYNKWSNFHSYINAQVDYIVLGQKATDNESIDYELQVYYIPRGDKQTLFYSTVVQLQNQKLLYTEDNGTMSVAKDYTQFIIDKKTENFKYVTNGSLEIKEVTKPAYSNFDKKQEYLQEIIEKLNNIWTDYYHSDSDFVYIKDFSENDIETEVFVVPNGDIKKAIRFDYYFEEFNTLEEKDEIKPDFYESMVWDESEVTERLIYHANAIKESAVETISPR